MEKKPGVILRSTLYSVIGHVMLFYPSVARAILASTDNGDQLISNWCLSLDSITHHDRRKISALLFIELIKNNFLTLEKMVNPVVCALLEVLTDLGTRKTDSTVEDNLILTEVNKYYLLDLTRLFILERKDRNNRKD